MHCNLKNLVFFSERNKGVLLTLLFFLASVLLGATTSNQFALSRYDDIFFSQNMYQHQKVNMDYKYEEKDINSLLQLRAKEERLDLGINILMLSLGDATSQLEYQLKKEYLHYFEIVSKKKTVPHARNILIPLNLTKIHHWVGIIIRLNKFNQVQQINYIDSLYSDIPANVKEFLQNVYGKGIKIENTQELLQTDYTGCGPLLIENLLRVAQGVGGRHTISEEEMRAIRQHHVELAKKYSTYLSLGYRQKHSLQSFEYTTKSRVKNMLDLPMCLNLYFASFNIGNVQQIFAQLFLDLYSSYNIFSSKVNFTPVLYGGGNTPSKCKRNDTDEEKDDADEENFEIPLLLAMQRFVQENFGQCIALCDEILARNPMHVEALHIKFSALLQEDKFEEALAIAKMNFEHSPSAETAGELISVYLETGEMERVLQLSAHVTEKWGEDYLNLCSRAFALIRLQKSSEGIRVSREALALFHTKYPHRDLYLPQHIGMLVKLHDGMSLAYLDLKQYKEALEEAERALGYNGNAATSLFVKGTVLLHMRKLDDAQRCFAACLKAGCKLPEVYCGSGYAHLYSGNYELASKILKKAYEMDPHDLRIAVGLFDAYCSDGEKDSLQEADRLIQEAVGIRVREGTEVRLANVTTRLSYAKEFHAFKGSPSLITVYIWNPLSNADYGHAAIKIEHLGKCYYFSWFPSGDDYRNSPDARRATPPCYGEKARGIFDHNAAEQRIKDLYREITPSNIEEQIRYLLLRKSDKAELHKSATYKIYFWAGIDIERMLEYWRTLHASTNEYNVCELDCCDTVLQALQVSLDKAMPDLKTIKTSKMKPNRHLDLANILCAFAYQTSMASGTKSTTVYKYCYKLACKINESCSEEEPFVMIRFNRWDKKHQRVTKFDFNPAKFDPNWLTRTKKIRLQDLYSSFINQCFSRVLYEFIDGTDDGHVPSEDSVSQLGYDSFESGDEDGSPSTEAYQPSKEVLQANKESIELITHALLLDGSTLNNIRPRWTEPDGDCAFHALHTSRKEFLEEVRKIYNDQKYKSHDELHRLFSTDDFRLEYGDFNTWYARINNGIYAGDFELHLIGLIRNIQIRIFGLGDNLFEQRYTVGVPNAPDEVWVAFVNMEPVTTANEHDGNHYIELQLPQPGFEHMPAQQNAIVVPVMEALPILPLTTMHGQIGAPVPPPSFL